MQQHHIDRRLILLCVCAIGLATPAAAQSSQASQGPHPVGRVSFFTNSSVLSPTDGTAPTTSQQLITSVSFEQTVDEGNGLEYGVSLRSSGFLTGPAGHETRMSLYDAYAGMRTLNGLVRVRTGSMWLTELGGLGAIAGGMVEVGQKPSKSSVGWFRAGGFYGFEPAPFAVNYVPGVRKYGGYGVLEGPHGRTDTVGYVRLENGGLLERSVITTTNFLPVMSHLFIYQTAEYDLSGPAGQGRGGLAYLFLNTRVQASKKLDLQGDYHRGRSIDTRSITDDILTGQPIPAGAVEGLLYESEGGRVTVTVMPRVRVNGGYTRDRNNQDSTATNRITAGVSASDIARSGFDLTVSASQIRQPTGRYASEYLSFGRQIAHMLYLSGDYTSSLSVVTFTRSDGIEVESRPATRQIGVNAVLNLGRRLSLLVTAQRTRDDSSSELRTLIGMTYRFK